MWKELVLSSKILIDALQVGGDGQSASDDIRKAEAHEQDQLPQGSFIDMTVEEKFVPFMVLVGFLMFLFGCAIEFLFSYR